MKNFLIFLVSAVLILMILALLFVNDASSNEEGYAVLYSSSGEVVNEFYYKEIKQEMKRDYLMQKSDSTGVTIFITELGETIEWKGDYVTYAEKPK